MDHDEVLEQLELAAVEPDGLARLMAGDTAIAAAVAGHLAGCDPCTGEFQRLGRAAPMLRDVVRTTPSADLRERTLAYVRARGVPRGADAVAAQAAGAQAVPVPAVNAGTRQRALRILPWAASLAAAVVIAVGASTYIADRQGAERYEAQERAIAGLEAVTNATIEITAEPDVKRVALKAIGATTEGSVLFSPSTTKLVVVARGLERPPAGSEYRCWVERAGKRENVGRMFFADDLAYWVGDVQAISDIPAGTTFGVSLADLQGTLLDAPPVIVGKL